MATAQNGQQPGLDPLKTGAWTHGLFGCFDNVGLCVVTFLGPCITFGQVAEAHGDSCVLYGALYLVPFLDCYLQSQYRETIRERRGIIGSFAEDLCTVILCPPCALTQESMEIRDIQAEETRIGAIQGGAPPGAFTSPVTGQPYAVSLATSQHQPSYPPGFSPGDEPYYPPSEGTWEGVRPDNIERH